MAQLVISAAGAAVGFMVGGPAGASYGWMAGSLLGAAFAPAQKSQGPMLGDLTVATSSYGSVLPYVQGHPRLAGQLIWASARRPIATTTEQGKGGGAEYTSYTYEVDLLIELTDNVIAGVSRVWSNGALVWSNSASADSGTLAASATTTVWRRMTVYTGAPTQLPDPTYEAAVGTANAPAYRGRATVFIEGLQLDGGGNIPNLTFEVGSSATFSNIPLNVCTVGVRTKVELRRSGATVSLLANDRVVVQNNTYAGNPGGLRNYDIGSYDNNQEFFTGRIDDVQIVEGGTQLASLDGPYDFNGDGVFRTGVLCNPGTGDFSVSAYITPRADATMRIISAQDKFAIRPTLWLRREAGGALRAVLINADDSNTLDISSAQSVITQGEESVMTVVSRLLLRAGLSASQFDVTALAAITAPVRALAISQVSSVRSVLETLAGCYFFEAVLSDKLYLRPRASTPAATLPFEDLGVSADGHSSTDPLPLLQASDLQIPAQIALTYSNVDGDYQTDTQYSDRLLTGQINTSALQLPMAFTAAEAKAIADAMLMDQVVGSLSVSISIGQQYTRLEPSDVVVLTGADGSTYRMRLIKRTDSPGILGFDAVGHDVSVLTQAGITSGGTTPQTVVMPLPLTLLKLLDIPILRDADDRPGLYVAVSAVASNWRSAGLYESLDNSTYALSTTITDQAVTGIATTALGNWTGGNVFDEVNTVTVAVDSGQLASVTRDQLLASTAVNAAVVGNELLQFRDATLISAGVYRLGGLLRGRRGTEWAMTGHAANERFVQLGASGMRFVTLQTSELGKLRYYKAASAGQRLVDASADNLTPAGVGLECFSPVDVRADRTSTDTALSWKRRTRLSTRLVGSLPISAPLGEAAESYAIEVYASAAFATLKRTLSASAPSVTYTSAQQVADFGANQSTLYLRIYQISAIVGRGYAAQAVV